MQEVVALNQGVTKLTVADASAALADTLLHKFAVEQLRHTDMLADFVQEINVINLREPVGIINNLKILTAENLAELRRQTFNIARHCFSIAQVTLLLFAIGVANHAGSAAD